MSELVPADPPELRLSDEERERVAEFLREQVGEGRLTLVELEERLGTVYSARVRGDLAGITSDLPVPARPSPSGRSGPPTRHWDMDPRLRRHVIGWAAAWCLWLVGLVVLGAAGVSGIADNLVAWTAPMLIWTCLLVLHWLRAQSG